MSDSIDKSFAAANDLALRHLLERMAQAIELLAESVDALAASIENQATQPIYTTLEETVSRPSRGKPEPYPFDDDE